MEGQDSGRLFVRLIQLDRKKEAFDLLLQNAERLRGLLELRYARHLPPGTINSIIVEAAVSAFGRAHEFRPGRPEALAFWVFQIGRELAIERVGKQPRPRKRTREQQVQLDETVERIGRLPDPHRTVLQLDLDCGGRAPIQILCEVLGVDEDRALEMRAEARLRFYKA
ncbi:MAG: hypothetical protein AAF682_07065 [Planctomycetota bacterium]